MEACMTLRILLVLLLLAPGLAVAQPSFDCGKASTAVERAICGDAKLAAADRELAGVYGALLGRLSGPAKEHLMNDQRRWLGNRGKSCTAELPWCLGNRYRQRIATLKAVGEGVYPFISEQALQQSGKVKAISYEIDARYPQFDGGAGFRDLNQYFARTARAGAAQAVPASDVYDPRAQTWTYDQSFALYRPGPSAVSVEVTSYIFTGGAHGATNIGATLVDLRSGGSVEPSDVFKEGAPWERAVIDMARADLKKQFVERPGFDDTLEPDKFDRMLKESDRYLFKPGALELIFNQYEVGPYAAGIYRVRIPYDRLAGLLRPDGLVQLAPVGQGRGGR
jgi:uncharacterized protein